MATRKNPLQPYIDQIPAPLKNRYFLVLILFFAWMVFFDRHDVWTQWHLQSTLKNLETDRAYYIEKIKEVREDKKDIEKNKEKFAREKYFMKRDNEDVFIIVKEGEEQ